MRIGLIGSGNMARALARGWGEPVLCTDSGSGRAAELAAEVGGEAVAANGTLADAADVVVLCHKPYQLADVAAEVGDRARVIASVLARVTVAELQVAYPSATVVRLMPNVAVELRQGVTCHAPLTGDADAGRQVLELFGRLGEVVEMPERLMDLAMTLVSTPAHFSLVAEALVDGAVRNGMPARDAGRLVTATMGGTAALLKQRDHDTYAVRRSVLSPGGSTIRGIAELEHAGVRGAFMRAVDAALGEAR